jgi:hypothetical protein
MRGGATGAFGVTDERERKREVVCAGWYRRVGSSGENLSIAYGQRHRPWELCSSTV